jgi:enamine deaminase RidA (YjgF/YER057c/UK114 family)
MKMIAEAEMIMERQTVSWYEPWDSTFGYAHAVRLGKQVFVSGTAADDADGHIVGEDIATQTRYIFHKIEQLLAEAGGSMQDVVRVRLFLKDVRQWHAAARVNSEFFNGIRPALTMVKVSSLINPQALIEIEVDAVIAEEDCVD